MLSAPPFSLAAATRRLAQAARSLHGGWMQRDEVVMGTAIHVELWSDDARRGQAAMAAVMAEMHRIDAAMSPVKPSSELARINRDAGTRAVPLSEEMFVLLARALQFSQLSGGAFDISYAAAGQLYNYREGLAPTDAALHEACQHIGWQALELDASARTLRFGRPGMRIDLGGFAKGHAVDNAARILQQQHGIQHALVSAGGDSRAIGDRQGRPWSVAIRDPRNEAAVVALLPLIDTSVSTSGDYERCFLRNGKRHHHILDPRNGRSPEAVRSVTILGPDGLNTEALSKSVFVLGVAEGLRLVESMPDTDAVIVDAEGALHHSRGLLEGHELAAHAARIPLPPAARRSHA